jgi:hypothetical protein
MPLAEPSIAATAAKLIQHNEQSIFDEVLTRVRLEPSL